VELAATDRDQVMEAVRSFFGQPHDPDGVLGGPLLEWVRLRGTPPWTARFEHDRTLESAELVELTQTTAVVMVVGEHRMKISRGFREYRRRLDGPALLEKLDGRWRVIDFTLDGRRRLVSIVRGHLAEQEQNGVTVSVLGVDRGTSATELLLEINNSGLETLRVDCAFTMFEANNAWQSTSVDSDQQIAPGATAIVLVNSHHTLELSEPDVFIALRLRATGRKLNFLLRVPLTPPEGPVRLPPPRRLPVFRLTWPRSLVFYAALTAGATWWYGWWAIGVPLYVALSYYWQVRAVGHLPARLHPFRYALDAGVVTAAFLLLWETPAVELAVPLMVAVLVYVALAPVSRRYGEARLVLALSAGASWLFLLGLSGEALSPCRIAGGSSGSAANSFAQAMLTGDRRTVRRLELSAVRGRRLPAPVSARVAAAIVSRRTSNSCFGLSSINHCFVYRSPRKKLRAWVMITCETRTWRVRDWIGI
jgi:hypothetical protein